MQSSDTRPCGSECNDLLGPAVEDAAERCLEALAGVDTHDVNLRDHPEAWAAIEAFAATALHEERARYSELLSRYHDACVDASRAQDAIDAARMAGVHSVHEQTTVIVRAALELLEAVEGCDAFPPEKMAAFRRVFGA